MAENQGKPIKMQLPTKKVSATILASKGNVIKDGNAANLNNYAGSTVLTFPITKNSQFAGSGANVTMTQPMFFSPLHTPQNWQIASKRKEVYQWARHYYENEPKVAAGIDFYSQFPINGMKLTCKKKSVMRFYERLVEKVDLMYWLRMISHQRFLLGDVYVMTEIECPHCKGSGIDKESGENCNHPDGTIGRVTVLNPDWIEVMKTPISQEPQIVLLPDEEIQKIIQTKQPKFLYDQIPDNIKMQIMAKKPILLSNRVTSHIKHGGVPYGTYGESLLRRLFTSLAYKTKLMTANWIVAERLILPVRIVKVGSDERPADDEAIADMSSQLSAVANDPNLTIVTHNNVEYEWYGACQDNLTEILTYNGWKLFKDISKDEIVSTYNKDSGFMQWQQIQKYHEYDFKSTETLKMIDFKSRGVDIRVTPNHRMLVQRDDKWIEVLSQEVKHGDKFLNNINWQGYFPEVLQYKDSPLSHLVLDDYLEFVGYYLSEGGVKRETKRNLSVDKQIQACSVGQNRNSPIYSSMKDVVELVYPNFSETKDDRGNDTFCNFTINNVKIARYMAEEFGSKSSEKKIPTWVLNLPKNKLKIVYDAMMAGDGDLRNDNIKPRYRYTTTSKNLSNAFSEIVLKLGYFSSTCLEKAKNERCNDIYRIYWSEDRVETPFEIRNQHISRTDYDGKVYCVTVPNGFIITRRNGRITVQGNSGKIHNINAELEFVGKEILDGLMLNQTLLNGEMAGYNSAQVGVEVMIRRLESWRNELAQWIEKNIFLPVAKMQGFIDEEETKEFNETTYLYPRIKWNDLRLRDNTNQLQMYLQMQQSGLISAQTLLEEFDLDYDLEVERIREEQVQAMQNGMLAGGQGAGGGGGGMGGGGGGGGSPGGAAGGMDMGMGGGGAPGMDGGMGGAPGMDGGMGGAPGGAPGGMGAAAGGSPQKIYRKGKGPKEEEVAPVRQTTLQLTKPESKMYRTLNAMSLPFRLFAQYKQPVPNDSNFYLMDFAIPEIGVDIEVDGEKWHSSVEDKQSDKERDVVLAKLGWRVLRFTEQAIGEQLGKVQEVIKKEVYDAAKEKKSLSKKAQVSQEMKYEIENCFDGCEISRCLPLDNEVKEG